MDWTDGFLDSMRRQCDPLADEVVRELFAQGKVGAVNELMRHLASNDPCEPGLLPPVLEAYFERTGQLPSWADLQLINEGSAAFRRCGPQVIISLVCAALPSCYAAAKGVQVLSLTGRLEADTFRRVVETSQMIIDVMSPGGLEPGGYGLRTVQKVRLMHAAVRHLARQSGRLKPEWDEPINQEDMAGTLVTFSVVTIRALARLGYTLSAQEAEAYYHAWRVIGHLMGVDSSLLPERLEEGELLTEAIFRRHHYPCPESQVHNRALVEVLERLIPGTALDGLVPSLMRHLLGAPLADMLGVPASDWTRHLIRPLQLLGKVADEVDEQSAATAYLAGWLGQMLMEGLVWSVRGPKRVQFRIPTELREAWRLQSGQELAA
jgi:hypothetical protein